MTTPLEEDQAAITGNKHKLIWSNCALWFLRYASEHTNKPTGNVVKLVIAIHRPPPEGREGRNKYDRTKEY